MHSVAALRGIFFLPPGAGSRCFYVVGCNHDQAMIYPDTVALISSAKPLFRYHSSTAMASSPTTSFPGSGIESYYPYSEIYSDNDLDDIPQSMPSTFQEAVLVSVSGSPNMVGESSVEGVSGPIPTGKHDEL